MKAQSRKASIFESIMNVIVGIGVAFVSQAVIFNSYGFHVTYLMNIQLTLWFTAVSIIRSFFLRRIFNWFTEHSKSKLESTGIPDWIFQPIEKDKKDIVQVVAEDGIYELPARETEAINHLTRHLGYEKQANGEWKRLPGAWCVTCRRPL